MYLKRLLIIIIITGSVAYITGNVFDHIYKKRWSVLFFNKTDELIKSNQSFDIIYLGNSRVHFGINPYYVDSVTKLNSYNMGFGGADMEDILLTSRVYLQHHPPPKLVVISLDMGGLTINKTLKTRFPYLFYLDNDSIRQYMNRAGYLTGMIQFFPFTKYCFFDEYNRTSLFVQGKQYPTFGHNMYKGFLNIHPTINSRTADLYNVDNDPDILWKPAIHFLKNAVKSFQDKGTRVLFISPPEKISSHRKTTTFRLITDSIFTNIANEYHLKFLHFENDTLYTDQYFVDEIHLNEPGTRLYSIQLADSIKTLLP